VQHIAGVVAALVIAAANFAAAAAAGVVIALVVSRLESRQRRKEVRAAEKRGRIEGQYQSVRPYAAALHGFVHKAVVWGRVWEEFGLREGREPPRGEFRQFVQENLQKQWHQVQELEPQPGPQYVVRDLEVSMALLYLELEAQACRDSWEEWLDGGDMMSQEEADRSIAKAGENLQKMLERMEQSLEEVEE
jgi:hypothetical protein